MKCVSCTKAELVEQQEEDSGIMLDVCPKCMGIWFDAGELEKILGKAPLSIRIPLSADRDGRDCPKCNLTFATFKYPGTDTEIDMCRNCGGVWLDSSEFSAVAQAAANEPPPPENLPKVEADLPSESPALKEEEEDDQDVDGAKGNLINLINRTIRSLSSNL